MIPIFYDTSIFHCVDSTTLWLSETPKIPSKGWDAACERVVSMLKLLQKESSDTLYVLNTHWDHVGEIARQKSSELIRSILTPLIDRDARFVLLGDLNATPDDPSVLLLASASQDACPRRFIRKETFNGFGKINRPGKHIDYIYISRGTFRVKRYFIPHWSTENNRWLSDHHAIVVTLTFAN